MASERWVRLYIPETRWDRQVFGRDPFVINEAPRGVGREVRLATDAETGVFGRLALPRRATPTEEDADHGETRDHDARDSMGGLDNRG